MIRLLVLCGVLGDVWIVWLNWLFVYSFGLVWIWVWLIIWLLCFLFLVDWWVWVCRLWDLVVWFGSDWVVNWYFVFLIVWYCLVVSVVFWWDVCGVDRVFWFWLGVLIICVIGSVWVEFWVGNLEIGRCCDCWVDCDSELVFVLFCFGVVVWLYWIMWVWCWMYWLLCVVRWWFFLCLVEIR